jgi:hypothetical protein
MARKKKDEFDAPELDESQEPSFGSQEEAPVAKKPRAKKSGAFEGSGNKIYENHPKFAKFNFKKGDD